MLELIKVMKQIEEQNPPVMPDSAPCILVDKEGRYFWEYCPVVEGKPRSSYNKIVQVFSPGDHFFAEGMTIKEFLDKYYKADRYTGRGKEYADSLTKSHQEHMDKNGFDIISHHDSKLGITCFLLK